MLRSLSRRLQGPRPAKVVADQMCPCDCILLEANARIGDKDEWSDSVLMMMIIISKVVAPAIGFKLGVVLPRPLDPITTPSAVAREVYFTCGS